jgi:hypothetical protein
VKWREFIVGLGGVAATWPLAARTQQAAMPVVGFLRSTPAAGFAYTVDPFRQGLNDAGFVEGKNVAIELPMAVAYATSSGARSAFGFCVYRVTSAAISACSRGLADVFIMRGSVIFMGGIMPRVAGMRSPNTQDSN